jgi:uncharacterized membrane protein
MNDESKLYGALAYLLSFITGILMLFIKPEDKFVKFHALQSILLGIVAIVLSILLSVVSGILWFIPIFGWLLSVAASSLLSLVFLLVWLFLMWKAYQGEKWKFPVVGEQAEKMVETVNLSGTTSKTKSKK